MFSCGYFFWRSRRPAARGRANTPARRRGSSVHASLPSPSPAAAAPICTAARPYQNTIAICAKNARLFGVRKGSTDGGCASLDCRLGGDLRAARRGAAIARGRVRLAPVAAFVAVALDLPRELLAGELERVQDLRRGVLRAQSDS